MYKVYLTCQGFSGIPDSQRVQNVQARLSGFIPNHQEVTFGDILVNEEERGECYCEPVVSVTYEVSAPDPHDDHHQWVISALDQALRQAGQAAVRTLVVDVGNYAGHMLAAGVLAGGVGGSLAPSENQAKSFAKAALGAALGAFLGGIAGSLIKRQVPVLSGSKDALGRWVIEVLSPGA